MPHKVICQRTGHQGLAAAVDRRKKSPAEAGLNNVNLCNVGLPAGRIALRRLVRSRTGARRLSGRRVLVRRRRVVAPLRLRRGLSRRVLLGGRRLARGILLSRRRLARRR
jgi:hypothetical protein